MATNSEWGVLFVDDEEQVLKSIERGLRAEEYRRFYAGKGK